MKMFDNYKKPTPVIWRKIGDSILLATMALSGMIMTLPLTENQKLWTNFFVNCAGIVGKVLTNLFAPKEGEDKENGKSE